MSAQDAYMATECIGQDRKKALNADRLLRLPHGVYQYRIYLRLAAVSASELQTYPLCARICDTRSALCNFSMPLSSSPRRTVSRVRRVAALSSRTGSR